MSKVIFSFLLLLPFLAMAQFPSLAISGTVTNQSTGAPIANHAVYVQLDSTATGGWSSVLYTDLNGAYAGTFQFNFVPQMPSNITVSTANCNGTMDYLYFVYSSANTVITNANFQICGSSSGTGCQAMISQSTQNGVLYATSNSIASSPTTAITSYAWSFAGMSSTLQNPSFNLANLANGAYSLCLTITDASGCSSSTCDSVLVSNSGSGGNCSASFTSTVNPATGVVTLAGTSVASAPNCAVTYNWTGMGMVFGSGQNITLTLNPGSYVFCLNTTDCNGCAASYCDSVYVPNNNPSNYGISGWVAVDSMNATGSGFDSVEVYLIQYDSTSAGGTLTLVQSQLSATWTNPNSPLAYFNFPNLAAGSYLVKAAMHNPASNNYANFLPTYYASNVQSLFWSGATTLYVPNNINGIYLHLIQGVNPGGPGFVGGLVSQGANKTGSTALTDVEVMLLDMNDNPIAYTYSDANGNYSFSNLAYGTYKIWAEVLGKTTNPIIVTLSATNPSATNNEIVVNSTNVTSGLIDNAYFSNINVAPNPTQGNTTLNVDMKQSGTVNVEILNAVGQVVAKQQDKFAQGENVMKLATANYPTGVYFVKVNVENKVGSVIKLVIE